MSKKSIAIFLIILSVLFALISLYSTFAFDEATIKLDDSSANYNLIYSLSDNDYQEIKTNPGDELYVDLNVTNNYDSNVKYGTYYRLISPNTIPTGFIVTLSSTSTNLYEEVIKPNESTYGCKLSDDKDQCCWVNSNGCCKPPQRGQGCDMVITNCCKKRACNEKSGICTYEFSHGVETDVM